MVNRERDDFRERGYAKILSAERDRVRNRTEARHWRVGEIQSVTGGCTRKAGENGDKGNC